MTQRTSYRTGPDLMTRSEVAAAMAVNPKTVTRWARNRQIGSVRTLSGTYRYPRADIEAITKGITDPMTPEQVAAAFDASDISVTRWCDAGRLRSFRTPGGHRRCDGVQVKTLLRGGR
jgi:excisionase family DNA binding protein